MKLIKFKVENFRSVDNSDWIKAEDVTCLVGTNESGKTNLLIALWKLNPANNEPIIPLDDYPRKKYHSYKQTNGDEVFISAEFEIDSTTAIGLSKNSGWHEDLMKQIIVKRKYNGEYIYEYTKNRLDNIEKSHLTDLLDNIIIDYNSSELPNKEDDETNKSITNFINEEIINVSAKNNELSRQDILDIKKNFTTFIETNYKLKINLNLFFDNNLFLKLDKVISAFDANDLAVSDECKNIIKSKLPKFVYYSDYGNLDSEIYLPHVIENFGREDLGTRERAKSRSLKVLFEFVNLLPEQILELGKEAYPVKIIEQTKDTYNRITNTKERIEKPKDVDIEAESKKKREREILLQSASTSLTQKFKEWWKQGAYKFRFQADGNHFRIWVSDDKRLEEIELEGRSKGLQWFFSFFLIFLVESKDTHSNCILLLDEPGISLHPMAQMDLINFFNSLSKENQLIYTTHSPFLVSPNNLSGVHAMYVGENGESVVSPDLRSNKKIAEKSIYPIHAAIGITVSETLLYGCQPVLVEGISDQIYLQLIKKYVLSQGKYVNDKEIVFIPTGGVKGMSPVIKILCGRDNELPFVLLDSDKPGMEKQKQLQKDLYVDNKDKILSISTFINDGEYEIEDLMPIEELARTFSKQYRRVNSEDDFDYSYQRDKPIVNQMEEYAKKNGNTLSEGWKVDLAKECQKSFDRILEKTSDELKNKWIVLFDKITNDITKNRH
ncbi:DNA replication and repair protein RecF [termite gut metagenome]|uniref:DNA replication and repair protein RecF n=1 Tax=termite gut metagenome TaxID=433724 RepID=A0A5J4RZ95_9ZZZZ